MIYGEDNPIDPWGGKYCGVKVELRAGKEGNFTISVNGSVLSYHCRDYVFPVKNESVCSNCHVESRCSAGKVFLPRKAPAVGTKESNEQVIF